MCRIQILYWACTACGRRGVNEDRKSSDYCPDAKLFGHLQGCYEQRAENIVCGPCRGDGGDFFRIRKDELGSAGLMAAGGATGRVDGNWGHGIGSSYGFDNGSIDRTRLREEPRGYYENQLTQQGASKKEMEKKSKKASWNADKQAKAVATTNAQDNMGLAQSPADVKVSGSAGEEPSALVRSETDAKASTSLNAEANVFVPGAWRHCA